MRAHDRRGEHLDEMRGRTHRGERIEEGFENVGLAQSVEALPYAVPRTKAFGQGAPPNVLNREETLRGSVGHPRPSVPVVGGRHEIPKRARPILIIHLRRTCAPASDRSETHESRPTQLRNLRNSSIANSFAHLGTTVSDDARYKDAALLTVSGAVHVADREFETYGGLRNKEILTWQFFLAQPRKLVYYPSFARRLVGLAQQIELLNYSMAIDTFKLNDTPESPRRAEAHWTRDRVSLPGHEQDDLIALPPELAFLAADGFSVESLVRAAGTAEPREELLARLLSEGKIAEEDYYRALAKRLGCRYYSGDPPLADSFDAAKGLRCGVGRFEASSSEPRIVFAPHAQFVPQLIKATLSGSIRSDSFVLTSPQRFASLIHAYRGSELLDVALGRLPTSLTAREGMTGVQTALVGTIAILAFLLGVADFDVLRALSSAILWLIFLASVALRSMAAIARGPEVVRDELTEDKLPNYTVVVALYREASVVEHLVQAIDAFDYPKSKLDIKLVVEHRDLETLSRIVELRLPSCYEVVVAPLGKPQTKPRALNIALSSARGELIVVYDAEDIPAPDQLRLAASHFAVDKGLDCLQARLVVRNHEESWLSKLFATEYAILFDIINPGLSALNLPIPLGGSSNHFRVQSLVGVGAWDEWNVTEDADLGIRLARFGYNVRALESDTWEEAPYEFGNWFRQRVRWQKGWMQTLIVHSRRPIFFWRDLGPSRALAATILILGAIFGCLFWPAFAVGTIWRVVTVAQGEISPWREMSDVFTYILALSGIWTILLPAVVAAKFRRLKVTTRVLLLLPMYYLMISAATWMAMFDLALRPHYWAKTTHGRSRQGPAAFVRRRQLPT
jgi:cellulose synthase/poly-beta-1,6-N-acetylglucosamine synthase-like glycosyltransferase